MTRLKQFLFKYQGHVSAALVLGGIDETGSYLYTVHPHGSVDQLPFATMGSGSLAAMAIFEAGYRDDLEEQEAIDLCAHAIKAGIFNDLGSGGNVDICVISKSKQSARVLRTYEAPIPHIPRTHKGYQFPRGTTEWLSEAKETFERDVEVTAFPAPAASAATAMTD